MYSRYEGYRPFDPMENTLSRALGQPAPPERAQDAPSEDRTHERPQDSARNDGPRHEPPPRRETAPARRPGGENPLSALLGGLGRGANGSRGGGLLGALGGRDAGLDKLLRGFRLDWDAGDILLVLILLYLSLESDDEEIIWILALSLLMGL